MVNYFSRNYYHWIADCLTRLGGIEYYREQTGRKPTLIINSFPSIWQVESLKLLGYELNDCIEWNVSKMKVKRLVDPSFRREGNLTSPMACSWFRNRILSNLPNVENKKPSFSSKIFISRPKTAGRHVVSEDEVLKTLTSFGFIAYTLENMSFSDQVRLFSQAEIVVAVHGAALTNIIFAQDLAVIELFGSIADQMYFLLANGLGFPYACLTSDPEASKHSGKFDGIIMNVTKLKTLVEEMLYISSNVYKSAKRELMQFRTLKLR